MHPRTPAHIIAQMRQRAREGATLTDIEAEFNVSRPTAVRYTKGINTGRPSARSDRARLRRIVDAHASGINSSLGAERFNLATAKSFTDMASYARRRLARSAQEASHV